MPSPKSLAADGSSPIGAPASHSWPRPDARLTAFFVIAAAVLAAWALAVPVFEAPDEPAHWQYARYVHDQWSLPLYQPGFEEANSPPLYYLAIAPIALPSKLPPMSGGKNVEGQPADFVPHRIFLHSDRDRAWYWPIFGARLITAAMSLVTVWLVYRAALEVTDWRGGLTAAAIVVFLPQFSFRAGTLSNDALVTMFAAALTWVCMRLLQRGFTWQRGGVAAVLLAGAYLSKISAIALLMPAALAIVEAPGPQASLVARASRLSVLLVAVAIVLPWSLRNVWLYGDPFAAAAMSTAVSHLITNRSLFSSYFAWTFPKIVTMSLIGVFGWMSVLLPKWAYVAYGLFGAILVGGVARAARTIDRRLVRVLVLAVIAMIAIVVHINLRFTQPQGRYLLPALPAMALLAVFGLRALPPSLATRAHAIVPVGLGVFNVWCLLFVLIPTYYPPVVRDVAPGERVLFPAAAMDLRLQSGAPADLRFRIVGGQPLWILADEIDAASFSTIEFELISELPGAPMVNGTVYFAGPNDAIDGSRRVDFAWTANGARQTVRVDLGAHPDWRGAIKHLRIDPIAVGGNAFVGRDVRLGTVRLHKSGTLLRS